MIAVARTQGYRKLPSPPIAPDAPPPFLDVDGDGFFNPVDIFTTIAALRNDRDPPAIVAGLANDTAPAGSANSDGLTFDPTIRGTVRDTVGPLFTGVASFQARVGDSAAFINTPFDRFGNFTFDPGLPRDGTADSGHVVHFQAKDARGNISQFNVSFTLDTLAPAAPSFNVSPPASLDAQGNPTTLLDQVALTGQSDPNTLIELVGLGLTATSDSNGRFQFAAVPLVIGANPLTVRASDAAGNQSSFSLSVTRLPAVTKIAELSPANGEGMVSLTRETIVRFDDRVDPSTVNADSFYLIANGQRLPGRIVVSNTERFATFFYDSPLPASTEVRVVIEGDSIMDRSGKLLDANGDNIPGGRRTADFTTLPVTRIAGTNIFGYVYESNRKNPDGSDIPVVGAHIEVDALPGVFAVTDETGFFLLEDMPAPEFFVHINGSFATAPDGFYYPNVGKPFHTIPGQATQLNMSGVPFDIYLPLMRDEDFTTLTPGQESVIGFGDQAKADLANLYPQIDPAVWDRLQLTVPADSLYFDDGTPGTQVMIGPVAPDRIPAPLPPGVSPTLVFTVQGGGATNFDTPAPLSYPNLYGLQPGEKRFFYSFDHDAGKWVIIGTGTVSADGLTIDSDAGVGIRAPGWGFVPPEPGTSPEEPPPEECEGFNFDDAWALGKALWDAAADLANIGPLLKSAVELVDSTPQRMKKSSPRCQLLLLRQTYSLMLISLWRTTRHLSSTHWFPSLLKSRTQSPHSYLGCADFEIVFTDLRLARS